MTGPAGGHEVRFSPGGQVGLARRGENLLQLARRLGLPLRHACGGRGSCTTCRIRLLGGAAPPPTEPERRRLPSERLEAGWRLACQLVVFRPLEVRIPTLLERIHEAQGGATGGPPPWP